MKKFLILLRARNAEFYRDRASLTWNLLLPLMLVVGFVFAFSDPRQDLFKVGVYAPAGGADRTALAQLKHIQIVPFDNLDKAISRVQHHQIDLLVAEARARHAGVATGEFGAHMRVALENDGPVTFWLEAHAS